MLILGVDTSGRQGSIALADCRDEDCDELEVAELSGGAFSAQLIPQFAALLKNHGRNQRELAGIAVVSGPGSFTGLRIGLAAVKGLAEILKKPVAAVSMLHMVAESGAATGRVWAVLEAGRSDVYCGEYEISSPGKGQVIAPGAQLLTRERFCEAARDSRVITPDPALAEFLVAKEMNVITIERPGSGAVARWGWRKIRSGQTTSPEALEADYIGRSDGEIFTRSG